MSGKKLVNFAQRNVVLISGVGIIGATHWVWNLLQYNPRLVPEDQRKELPIIIGLRHVLRSMQAKLNSLTDDDAKAAMSEKK